MKTRSGSRFNETEFQLQTSNTDHLPTNADKSEQDDLVATMCNRDTFSDQIDLTNQSSQARVKTCLHNSGFEKTFRSQTKTLLLSGRVQMSCEDELAQQCIDSITTLLLSLLIYL